MTIRQSWRNAAALLLASILSACATTPRPTPPPAGIPVKMPWGAVPFDAAVAAADESVSDALVESLRAKFERARDESDDVKARPHVRRLLELTNASIHIALYANPAPASSALANVNSLDLKHLI